MAEIKITATNFETEVLHSDKPVLVDFWADWCGPCRMLAPVLEELAREHEGELQVGKVNVDEEMSLAQQFGVTSIPMLLLFKDGKPVAKSVGYRPKDLNLDKKDPDIFLLAAEKCGVQPADCTLYDDSLDACRGAKAAEMHAVGVYDPYFSVSEAEMRAVCDGYIHSFTELLER